MRYDYISENEPITNRIRCRIKKRRAGRADRWLHKTPLNIESSELPGNLFPNQTKVFHNFQWQLSRVVSGGLGETQVDDANMLWHKYARGMLIIIPSSFKSRFRPRKGNIEIVCVEWPWLGPLRYANVAEVMLSLERYRSALAFLFFWLKWISQYFLFIEPC